MASYRPNWEKIDRAEELAGEHRDTDPLPGLEPSLLSAAHIEYYVRTTGMLDCFDPDALKSASYEVPVRGEVIFWDEKGSQVRVNVDDNKKSLRLAPNSITFAQVEPYFRMPNYIAFRFNLRIHHVHRGLLLGTGPLVDPGFEGKILIPLHNLTATPYVMDLNKALIWIEFTKTSFKRDTLNATGGSLVDFEERGFPREGKNKSADEYLNAASGGFPIVSSIPDAVEKAARRAEDAETSAKSSNASLEKIRTIGLLALLAAIGGIVTIVFSALNLTSSVRQDLDHYHSDSVQRTTALETKRESLEKEITDLRNALEAVKAELRASKNPSTPPPARP